MSTITRNRSNREKQYELQLLQRDSISFHYTFECRATEANRSLMRLYYCACTIFARTSDIFTLEDDECTIKGGSDLLSDMKLHAQMLLLSERRIMAVSPISMRSFACETSVGELAYFGFAKYQESIVVDARDHKLHDGKKAFWKGFVQMRPRAFSRNQVLQTIDEMNRFMRLAEQSNLLREYSVI